MLFWLGPLLTCVAVNAFLVMSEYSLISFRQSRIQELIDDGNRRALVVHRLKKDQDRTLHCLQLGVIVTTFTLGGFTLDSVQPLVNQLVNALQWQGHHVPSAAVYMICCGVVVYLQLILGEQLPKLVSINMAEDVALGIAPILSLYCVVVRPLAWLAAKTISALLSLHPAYGQGARQNVVVSPDELEIILHQSEEAGELTERQTDMLEGVLDLHDEYVAQQAMTPLEKIACVPESATLHELLSAFARYKRTKLVVYRGGLQTIVGIIYTKDLFDLLVDLVSPANVMHKVGFVMSKWMRPVYRVKGSVRASELVDEMRRRRTQIAIVIDDSGKNLGLITMEDLLEKIVGDITDHHETPRSPPQTPPGGANA